MYYTNHVFYITAPPGLSGEISPRSESDAFHIRSYSIGQLRLTESIARTDNKILQQRRGGGSSFWGPAEPLSGPNVRNVPSFRSHSRCICASLRWNGQKLVILVSIVCVCERISRGAGAGTAVGPRMSDRARVSVVSAWPRWFIGLAPTGVTKYRSIHCNVRTDASADAARRLPPPARPSAKTFRVRPQTSPGLGHLFSKGPAAAGGGPVRGIGAQRRS